MRPTRRTVALRRIQKLFLLARSVIHEDEGLAQHYVDVARRISMASRVHFPTEYQRQICKGCKKFILPGVNCHARIQSRREPHVVVTCHLCGRRMRYLLRSHCRNAHPAKDNK